MSVKHLRWLFVGIISAFLLASIVSGPFTVGLSQTISSSDYRFAGGTRPWALVLAVVAVCAYFLLVLSRPTKVGLPLPLVLRRFIAFWLDFVLAMLAVAPVSGLLAAFVEWKRTGVFALSFERTTRASSDGLLLGVVFAVDIVFLLFYFTLPLIRRRPSPGTCILGYQIVPDDGTNLTVPAALARTVFGLLAVGLAYIAPVVARDRSKGKFWLDKVSRTHAVVLA
jgi:hypothetical protein